MLHDQLIATFKVLDGTLEAVTLTIAQDHANLLLSIGDFSSKIEISEHAAALLEHITLLKGLIESKHSAAHRAIDALLLSIKRFQNNIPRKGCCIGWVRAWAEYKARPESIARFTLEHIVLWQRESLDFLPLASRLRDGFHRVSQVPEMERRMVSSLLMFSRQGQAATRPSLNPERLRQQLAALPAGQTSMLIMRNAFEGHALGLCETEPGFIALYDHNVGKEIRLEQQSLAQALLDKAALYSSEGGLIFTDTIVHRLNIELPHNTLTNSF